MATNTNVLGAFLPTTNIWDPTELNYLEIDPELKELLVRMYFNLNRMSTIINMKDTGYYNTMEIANAQYFFPTSTVGFRPDFRILVNFGPLPNTGTKSVPHGLGGISSSWIWTRIYATATDTTGLTGVPIPYASNTPGASIELNVDSVNVNITTGSNRTNYNICYVVLEYLKF